MKRLSGIAIGSLIAGAALFGCAMQPSDGGWVTLLDGPKGLDNFNRVGTANWRVVTQNSTRMP